jgi:hypothetical protein
MSAIPEDFIRKTARLSDEVTRAFPNSRKIYVKGSRADIRVPMREVEQADTPASFGSERNPRLGSGGVGILSSLRGRVRPSVVSGSPIRT